MFDAERTNEWVSGSAARSVTGFSWGKLHRYALVGKIGVELIPGCAPRYRRADVEALARAQRRPSVV
jgi:hypothetical protein